MGAYLRVLKSWPSVGSLTVGGALFGMHYEYDEVGLTYGQGGYFSPDYYASASLPIAFQGHLGAETAGGPRFHYAISAAPRASRPSSRTGSSTTRSTPSSSTALCPPMASHAPARSSMRIPAANIL